MLLIIIILQGAFFYVKIKPFDNGSNNIIVDAVEQSRIDSLKLVSKTKDTVKIYPFNPNFITDYKAYTLGMSVDEIDRLHTFRSLNKYVNSKEEFQNVTGINDSLLKVIAPYFKFPDWVKANKKEYTKKPFPKTSKEVSIKVRDINLVTAEDLKIISGIGDKLSERIIKFRDRLGGFLVNEQLYDVYGLDMDVADKALENFKVIQPPQIKKININSANEQEIARLVYISYAVAANIVVYREVNGSFKSLDQLTNIDGFPSEKLDRIALYLSL